MTKKQFAERPHDLQTKTFLQHIAKQKIIDLWPKRRNSSCSNSLKQKKKEITNTFVQTILGLSETFKCLNYPMYINFTPKDTFPTLIKVSKILLPYTAKIYYENTTKLLHKYCSLYFITLILSIIRFVLPLTNYNRYV